jgi:rubrerythrin
MIKGSITEQNLLKAFAGESQARNRYTMYASVARKEGYEQIAAIFLETADNEREHASLFYKKLEGGVVEITATYPAGNIGTTLENLEFGASGENEEWTTIYPEFAKIAKEEGFNDVAVLFTNISTIEKTHEERYRKLLNNIKNDKVFKSSNEVEWVCRECGYVHKGTEAPKICPVCSHLQSFYQLKVETY